MVMLETQKKLKVLVAIASYGTSNDQYLSQLLAEYRSMSFDVDVVVMSNLNKALGPGIEVAVGLPEENPWSLPFAHKQIFADRLDQYDLFIYSEDDTLITERNLCAFVRASGVLADNELAGFLRFEVSRENTVSYPEIHGHFHWDVSSVRLRGGQAFAFLTNEHSACYVLTREQLRRAIASGGFLVRPHQEKYDLLCSAATDPYTQCGFRRLICISQIDDFVIHHLPNKYVGKLGVGDAELRRQISRLMQVGGNGHRPTPLFKTDTKLRNGLYSKGYYEPARPEILSLIPANARRVLSVGCGWGATEVCLVERGMAVTALPLDPVIPGGVESRAMELVAGDFETAVRQLAGRQFDCILLLDLLHLVENPRSVLSSLKNLMTLDSVAVVSVPNLQRLPVIWQRLQGDDQVAMMSDYERGGVHWTSRRALRRWVNDAGMRIESLSGTLAGRSRRASRATLGLMNSYLASEFIAAVRRAE